MVSIYLIEDCDGLKYIGSTKNKLNHRLSGHKADKKRNKPCSSSKLNLEDCCITEIQKCNESNRKEREQYWIDNTNCVNQINPLFDEKQYHKEYHKENYQRHKERSRQKGREYYENNKQKIKEYLQNNKDKRKEYYKDKYIETVVKNCLDDLIKQVEDLN